MKQVLVKNLIIGDGTPKICVPIVATTKDQLISQLPSYKHKDIDMLEWRGDYLKEATSPTAMIELAKEIRSILPDIPLLFTFRTKQEGGEQELSVSDYFHLNYALAQSGLVDFIDLELLITSDKDAFLMQVSNLKKTGVKLIFSNHDFYETPSKDHIISTLLKMQDYGADIAKIALMPQTPQDVLTLLSATYETSLCSNIPIVTMSMGKLGCISRVSGACFGSSITFSSLTEASAPGQIPIADLKHMLQML